MDARGASLKKAFSFIVTEFGICTYYIQHFEMDRTTRRVVLAWMLLQHSHVRYNESKRAS